MVPGNPHDTVLIRYDPIMFEVRPPTHGSHFHQSTLHTQNTLYNVIYATQLILRSFSLLGPCIVFPCAKYSSQLLDKPCVRFRVQYTVHSITQWRS